MTTASYGLTYDESESEPKSRVSEISGESATFSEEFIDAAGGTMNTNPNEHPAYSQGSGAGSGPSTTHTPQQQTFSFEQMQALLQALQSQGGPMNEDRPPKEKMPKLVEFDGTREDWENWKLVTESKIRIDGAAIGSEMDQLDYVHSRLRKGAANMVRAFIKQKREAGDGSAGDLIAYMEGIYGDPDKVDRALSQLHRLRQRVDEPFSAFLPRFETLLSEAGGSGFPSAVQIAYLRESINEEMSRALIGLVLPKEYGEYAARLQDVGSQLARHAKYVQKKVSGGNGSINAQVQGEPMDWEPVKSSKGKQWPNNCGCKGNDHTCGRKRAKWVTQEVMTYRRNNQLCLRCGNAGHMVKDCRFLAAKRPGPTPNPSLRTSRMEPEEGYRQKAMAEEVGPDVGEGDSEKSLALGRSRDQGPEKAKSLTSKADRTETRRQWEAFKPKMEGFLFYAETLVNDVHLVQALIDSGSGSYALMSEEYARKIKLDTIPIHPRPVEGVVAGMNGEIRKVARLDIDMGGYRMRRVFAYILPEQTDDLILGRPWMKHEEPSAMARESSRRT